MYEYAMCVCLQGCVYEGVDVSAWFCYLSFFFGVHFFLFLFFTSILINSSLCPCTLLCFFLHPHNSFKSRSAMRS
jgi:hypothetical protein